MKARFRLTLLLLAPAWLSAQMILSDFELGADGWHAYAGADPSTAVQWSATSGLNGSGGLTLVEPANGANDYWEAPAKFNGNLSAYFNGTVSFDLQLNFAPAGAQAAMIILSGFDTNHSALSLGFLPASSSQYPVTTGFTHFSLQLSDLTAWAVVNSSDYATSTLATNAQIQSVLSNVTGFRIMGDWSFSQDRDVLDNVRLQAAAVPEPSAGLLLGLGIILSLAWLAWVRARTAA